MCSVWSQRTEWQSHGAVCGVSSVQSTWSTSDTGLRPGTKASPALDAIACLGHRLPLSGQRHGSLYLRRALASAEAASMFEASGFKQLRLDISSAEQKASSPSSASHGRVVTRRPPTGLTGPDRSAHPQQAVTALGDANSPPTCFRPSGPRWGGIWSQLGTKFRASPHLRPSHGTPTHRPPDASCRQFIQGQKNSQAPLCR